MSWTQQFQQRQTAKRLAEKLRKRQAEDAVRTAQLAATAVAMPDLRPAAL